MELTGRHVVVLATDGVSHSDLLRIRDGLARVGAVLEIASHMKGKIKAGDGCTDEIIEATMSFDDLDADKFDAVIVPGGELNADALRVNERALAFIRAMFKRHKVVAAVRQGATVLIDTGLVKARKITSGRSRRTDFENAGAIWLEREVVQDSGLVTTSEHVEVLTAAVIYQVAQRQYDYA